MLDGFHRIALFLKSNSQCRVAIGIQRAKQQCTAANLDGTVEFAFLQQRMAQSVTGEKVIGTYRYCFLVMSDCFVNPALLKKKIGQGDLSIGVGWSHGYGLLRMWNCLVDLPFR